MIGLLLALGLAHAEPPTELLGKEIALVALEGPEGGLLEESLEPLLESSQGEPLSMEDVRRDIVTLQRVGEFASVQAHVEPWPLMTADGEIIDGVVLTYRVWPAPRITKLRLQGMSGSDRKAVLDAAALPIDSIFHPDLDVARLEERAVGALRGRGYPEAEVEVDVFDDGPGTVEVWIRADPGQPQLAGTVAFTGSLPLPEARLRHIAAKAGVKEGKPLGGKALRDARLALADELTRMRRTVLQAPFGWIEARVTALPGTREDGATDVAFQIEPGPRISMRVRGLGWRGQARARAAIGIEERLRITRSFPEVAKARLLDDLHVSGQLEAEVDVFLQDDDTDRDLMITVRRGPRFRVASPQFEGNDTVPTRDLRAALAQSNDTNRLRFYRPQALDEGLDAIRGLYAARGHPHAAVRTNDGPWRNPEGPRPGRTVPLVITVEEGPLVKLVHLDLLWDGERNDAVDLADLEVRATALVDAPFSPRDVESLGRLFRDRYQEAGHLDADVRAEFDRTAEGAPVARLRIVPGPQVLLRSVLVRGTSVTRRPFLLRELDLVRGAPLTTGSIDTARQALATLGVFRSVTAEVLGDGSARDLVLRVDERARWAFELGGGVNTDQGVRLFGRVGRRNLWGIGHRAEAQAQIGLDWAGDGLDDWTLDTTAPEWRAALTYTAPRFPARNQELTLDVLAREQVQERTWQLARSGVGLTLESTFGPTRLLATARWETRALREFETGALLTGEPWRQLVDASPGETVQRPQETLSLRLIHDRRDDPLKPSRGFVGSAYAEWSPGIRISGDQPRSRFLKGEAAVTGYIPLGGATLRVTGFGGHAWSYNGTVVPLEDRFRLGGTGSLRGFKRDAVGPRNRSPRAAPTWPSTLSPAIDLATTARPERWVPTGGDTIAQGVVELILPLAVLGLRSWDGYSLSIFADVGQVWVLDPDTTVDTNLSSVTDIYNPPVRYGIGIGPRVQTPIGPLSADVALNIEAIRARGATRDLLRTAWEEPTVRVHLTLGNLW